MKVKAQLVSERTREAEVLRTVLIKGAGSSTRMLQASNDLSMSVKRKRCLGFIEIHKIVYVCVTLKRNPLEDKVDSWDRRENKA